MFDMMKNFIDPTPNHYEGNEDSTRMMVFQSKYNRRPEYVGKIKNIKADRGLIWDGIDCYATTEGDYVRGALANPENVYYSYAVGTSPAYPGVWFGGYVENMERMEVDGKTKRFVVLSRAIRSDGAAGPYSASGGVWNGVALTEWFRAAPWTMELMPRPEDSEELRAAKFSLAQQRWDFNYALSVILTEAMTRDWAEQLKELDESLGWLPTYTATATAAVTAMIPVERTELTIQERAALEEQRRIFNERTGHRMGISTTSYATTETTVMLGNPRSLLHGRLEQPYTPAHVNDAVRNKLSERNAVVHPSFNLRTVLARQFSYA